MRYIFKKIFLKTKFFLNSYNIACPLDYRQNHFDLSNILKLKGDGGGEDVSVTQEDPGTPKMWPAFILGPLVP